MQPENMCHQQVSGFQGGREFRERDKVNRLRESINHSEYSVVTFGGGQTGNKIHCDV